MSLAGKGAILIWNDAAADGMAEFYAWHNNEHMPERLGIPGFKRGSRYAKPTAEGMQKFLTLYELADRGVATSDAYLARLNAPTDGSRRTMVHFRNMLRALTSVEVSIGSGHGGVMASVRFDDDAAGAAAFAKVRANPKLLAQVARTPRLTGVHLCATDAAASAAKTAESRHRGDTLVAPCGVILIEGCDVAAVDRAVADLAGAYGLAQGTFASATYALEHTLSAGDPVAAII